MNRARERLARSTRSRWSLGHPAVFVTLALLALATAAAHALRLAWVTDDAYISFRYAENLVHGHGLVYNVGERVEGYSNFLWTLWCALGIALGASPGAWSIAWGVAAYVATLGLLARFSWSRRAIARIPVTGEIPSEPGPRIVLPVAAWLGAVHRDWAIYATGGLETSLFTLLVVAGYGLLVDAPERGRRSMAAGAVLALAAMTRPDGVLFAAVGGIYLLLASRRRWWDAAAYVLPLVLLLGPYAAWKLGYYGDLLPNTYYAKSAGRPWYSQGLTYVGLYFAKYWLLPIGAAGCLWAWRRVARDESAARPNAGGAAATRPGERGGSSPAPAGRPAGATRRSEVGAARLSAGGASPESGAVRAAAGSGDRDARWRRAVGLALAFALVYTWYVAHVGGDFMYARLLVPATPFYLILIELAMERLVPARRGWPALAASAAALALALTPYPFRGEGWVKGIINEWAFYTPQERARARAFGLRLRQYFRGLPVRAAFCGGQAILAYYSQAPLAIESATGLTDPFIAHQRLDRRGRVGHEKGTPIPYLIARRAHFCMWTGTLWADSLASYLPLVRLKLDTLVVTVITWDPPVIAELERRGAVVDDFPAALDEYRPLIPVAPVEQVREVYEKARRFYFDGVRDSAREAPFLARLGRSER